MKRIKGLTLRSIKRTEKLVGLDWNDSALYAIVLEQGAACYQVMNAGRLPLAHGVVVGQTIQDKTAFAAALRQLRTKVAMPTAAVAVAMPAASVISKIVHLEKGLTDYEIERHLDWQIAHYLNLLPASIYFDYEQITSPENTAQQTLRLVAARREEVDERVTLLQAAGWQVAAVDAEPLVMERMATWLLPQQDEEKAVAIMHLTSTLASLYVIQQGHTVFNRVEHYPLEETTTVDWPTIFQRLWQWFALLAPTRPERVFLSGEAAYVAEALAAITPAFAPLQAANPFLNCEFTPGVDTALLKQHATAFLLSYGLALRRFTA